MKRQKQMQKAFGTNEFGLVDYPVKISNVQVHLESSERIAVEPSVLNANIHDFLKVG